MRHPELFDFSRLYLFISWIDRGSFFLEGKIASNHCEENRTSGKYINLFRLVLLTHMNFWGHVLFCSSVCLSSVSICCKSEVANFEIKLIVNEKILHFEISVENAFGLHK